MKAIAESFPFLTPATGAMAPTHAIRAAREAPRTVPAAPSGVDEAALCAAALRGEVEAWNALFERHNHRVVVTLLARGIAIDRAKDIAQEAWIRLIEQQRLGRLERLQLPGLAITQATFLALEAMRREPRGRRHEPLDEPAIASTLTDPRADAESRLLTEERVAQAVDVLSRCSPSARKVFRLAYGGGGLSHADVASRVGLSLQRVRQILCEVRGRLRTALEDEETV